jgi:hypothetical protein
MVTLRVKVEVTEDREVTIKLPDDFPVGEAKLVIAVESDYEESMPVDEPPLTDEEIDGLLKRKPAMTGAEIIVVPSHRLQLTLYTRNLKHFAPLLGRLAQELY